MLFLSPFKNKMDNILNIYNELIILIAYISILVINFYEISEFNLNICGYANIAFIGISLFISLYFVVITVFKSLCRKKKPNAKKKKKGNVKRCKTIPAEKRQESQKINTSFPIIINKIKNLNEISFKSEQKPANFGTKFVNIKNKTSNNNTNPTKKIN